MNIIRRDFINALKAALPGVESNNVILEGADTFIFDNGFIHTYNDNISVSTPFAITNKNGENISGAIKAKEFFDLVNRFKDETIKLIPKNDAWIIKTDKVVAELTLLETKIIEKVKKIYPAKIKWESIPDNFIEGISICQFTANKSALSGIFVENEIITSTDEIRINWFTLSQPISGSFWISDGAISELVKLSSIKKYCISESWIHFMAEDKTIFSCKRLAQQAFPFKKIKTLVDAHAKEKTDISNTIPNELIAAVNRAAALSCNIESFDTVRLTFNTENIEVFAQRPSGKYTELVPWEKPFKKEIKPIGIFVDYAMIENGIRYSKSFYLKKNGNDTRIVFAHPNGVQLISTFEGNAE